MSSAAPASTAPAGASSPAASASAAASSPAAPAAGSSVASSRAAASPAAGSTSAAPASASSSVASAAASSASEAASSSIATSSSAATSSRSIARASASVAASSGSKSGLSGGAIGGIAGGAAGGVLLVLLIFFLLRRRRDKKDWVAPPPPKEMTFNSQTINRNRAMSSTMLGSTTNINRASSYSTLLNARASSQYPTHSRSPSYYAAYPVGTPSSGSHEASPPMPPTVPDHSQISASLPNDPVPGPGHKPSLAPINTSLQRDGSSGSDGSSSGASRGVPRKHASVDRLREAHQASASRPASPGTSRAASEGGSSRATSPGPSHEAFPRHSMSGGLSPGYPRPYSVSSLSSSTRPSAGQQRGAPHQRHVQLEMPKLLGARPDSNGDFFTGMPKSHESMHWNSVDGHARRTSRPASEIDFAPPTPRHARQPSSLSNSSIPRQAATLDDRRRRREEV